MRPVVTPTEMAARDEALIASGILEAILVERAGAAVARAARSVLGGTYGRRVVVVCGKGNNGADGRVAGRLLAVWGARVEEFRLADGLDRAGFARGVVRAHLVVDAMYGTGFRGGLDGDAAWVAETLEFGEGPTSIVPVGGPAAVGPGVPGRRQHWSVLAVDIPSGVDGSTGAVTGPSVRADVTVCLAALKPGLVFSPGADRAGLVRVTDIGIDPGRPDLGVTEDRDVRGWMAPRQRQAHKWSVGGVYVVGGSTGMAGAAALSARAALRAGAGIVVGAVPGGAGAGFAGDEVITRALAATADGSLATGAVTEVLGALDRFRALVVGPGLGRAPETAAAVRRLVAEAAVGLVLDADGLNALGCDFGPLHARQSWPTVLTPHEGEYQRLAGTPVGDDRVAAARALAAASRTVVLLKGPQTVVAAPSGRAAVNPNGGPWLATAGTGDVLTGIVGALLAQGQEPFEAAAAAAFLHGRAAEIAGSSWAAGKKSGNPGLVAGDLIDALPSALLAR